MKSILDPSFQYTSSAQTDIRRTFAKIWRAVREQPEARADVDCLRTMAFTESNDGLVNLPPIEAVILRESAPGMELVTFVPQADETHRHGFQWNGRSGAGSPVEVLDWFDDPAISSRG